ncbi:MAG: polyprenyl synthetase family protein [Candidatus Magnetoovum sp. WYHC-5]|nr:polyprenyl synthetase family protein [Candidatus Magnetoovum sp. WYHC-5]
MELKQYLNEMKANVEAYIREYFEPKIDPPTLHEAMKYSLFAGGKRIRPVLCITAYEACGGNYKDILPQASAIELIHTYSLIHDDLPAMDDDDLRRGKPTNHKVYGEAMAILAGDGLLTEAFLMFTKNLDNNIQDKLLIEAIRELAACAGLYGMVAGQAMDIIAEGKTPQKETVEFIHKHKTGALLKASVMIGGILFGASQQQRVALHTYGRNIGLAFQVVDDILDIVGTTEELGKPKGSDYAKMKMTYPAVYGIEESKQIAAKFIKEAVQAADVFEQRSGWLKQIANYLLERTN